MNDPRAEPCLYCGRDADECICDLADVADQDPLGELTSFEDEWDSYPEDVSEETETLIEELTDDVGRLS